MLCTFSKGLFLNSRTFFKGLFALFCHFFKGLSVAKIRKYLKLGAFFLKNIVNLAKECMNNRFHIEIYQVIFIPLYVRNTSELLYSDEEDKTLNI